jgi:hypothetical protein
MRFATELTLSTPVLGRLVFIPSEESFVFEPLDARMLLALGPNGTVASLLPAAHLSIRFAGDTGAFLDVVGFCPRTMWRPGSLNMPSTASGIVRVHDIELELDQRYRLSDHDWLIQHDPATGIVKLSGAREAREGDMAVEFASGCFAVVREDRLIALYLTPEFL